MPKFSTLQTPPRFFKVGFCQPREVSAPGCKQLPGSDCQACGRHSGNCSSTTRGPPQDKVEQRETETTKPESWEELWRLRRIHESQPGQRGQPPGQTKEWTCPLTGTAGQRGQTRAARLARAARVQESCFCNAHSGNSWHAAFCVSWHMCQQRPTAPRAGNKQTCPLGPRDRCR